MGKLTVRALRTVLVMVLTGTVFVQALMVWALVSGSDPEDGSLPLTPLRVITILGMVAVQVALVCVWRLVTMVRRGTVFSDAAFRSVDLMIGVAVVASLLTFGLAVVLAPGEAVPPGMVLLVCGGSLIAAGIALVVLVMRTLLAQAISREVEASDLRAELDEVI